MAGLLGKMLSIYDLMNDPRYQRRIIGFTPEEKEVEGWDWSSPEGYFKQKVPTGNLTPTYSEGFGKEGGILGRLFPKENSKTTNILNILRLISRFSK